MRTYRWTILRISGIPIQIDASWLVIAVVLTWSLAGSFREFYPPGDYPDWTEATYWSMAAIAAAGIFVCLVLHELGHSLVGQRFGMKIRSITLFIFGGVAELEKEPPSARAEFWMAVAGPAVSVALAAGFALLAAAGQALEWLAPVVAVLWQWALLNAVLVAFNLLPAFPLDGGRVLRAILWAASGDLQHATAITGRLGQGLGDVLMVVGVFNVLMGVWLPGLWWMLLGWFLQNAARSSYEQVLIQGLLSGQPVRRFMTANVISVPPELDVQQLVDEFFYRQHHQLYPVRSNGQLLGYVTPQEVKRHPQPEWTRHCVRDIMATRWGDLQISPDADATEALTRMQRTGQTRLFVVEQDALVGVLTLRDLLDYLRLRFELDQSTR